MYALDDSRGADITAADCRRVESRTNKLVVSGNFRQPSFPVRRGVSNYKPAFLRVYYPPTAPPATIPLLPLFFRPHQTKMHSMMVLLLTMTMIIIILRRRRRRTNLSLSVSPYLSLSSSI